MHFVRVYILASSKHEEGWENSRQLCKQETSSRIGFASRIGFGHLSRILPAPRMFRWAYVNPEKVLYCSFKMILNTTSKTVESSLISSGFNSNDWEKENLRTKFGELGELWRNKCNYHKVDQKVSSSIHLYLVSELLLCCEEFLKIVSRRRASRFNDRLV